MSRFSLYTRLLPGDPRTRLPWDSAAAALPWADELEGRSIDDPTVKAQFMPEVNAAAGRALNVDDVIVRGMLLCNSEPDYYHSRFPRTTLSEIAELSPGSPVIRMHRSGYPESRMFRADVVHIKEPGRRKIDSDWTRVLDYTLNSDEGRNVVQRRDGGLDREVSIGWRCVGADCTECGDPIYACRHIPGDIYDKGLCRFEFSGVTSVLEGSHVYRGGQKNTTTFVPDGAGNVGSERMAAVAAAVNRFLEEMSGEVAWDRVASLKREYLDWVDWMPREIRVAAEQYRRAVGMGVMCAEPGARADTQAVICARERFSTPQSAARWVRDHDFRADRRSDTADGWRFDQFKESRLDKDSITERTIDEGVRGRIGKPKAKDKDGGRARGLPWGEATAVN